MQMYTDVLGRQDQKIRGREHLMTKTSDGAYAFKVDDWGRLSRFLILGADSPTYYASRRQVIRDNAQVVDRCLQNDGIKTVDFIAEVSIQGLAPNNDPAIFALAMASLANNVVTRKYALSRLPDVCRIGTHLFHFVAYREGLGGGWGRATRRAVRDWYNGLSVDKLAYQVTKYKQRDGWSHRDLLRLSHPQTQDAVRNDVYRWVTRDEKGDNLPARIFAAIDVHSLPKKQALKLIADHHLTHEMVPNEMKGDGATWDVLLHNMPMMAMVRNLGKMTSVGLLKPMSRATKTVVERLGDVERIGRARVHPIALLTALRTYERGQGDKGSLTWQPVSAISTALEEAFYLSFKTIEPTGLNTGLYLDVSPSMNCQTSFAGLTPRELSAAMALVTAHVEPNHEIFAFAGGNNVSVPGVRRGMSIKEAVNCVSGIAWGGTDLSLPFVSARHNKLDIEVFVVYTDNETNNFRGPHPSEALKSYRRETGIDAKSIVVGMTSNNISIADPMDRGMLDVVGFDSSAPSIMSEFARGMI